jgi:hypothetical protein
LGLARRDADLIPLEIDGLKVQGAVVEEPPRNEFLTLRKHHSRGHPSKLWKIEENDTLPAGE